MPRRHVFIVAANGRLGQISVMIECTHPWTARIETPATFDKNKSLSSGVRDDSRIELRAGSTKCRELCNRVRMDSSTQWDERTAIASEVRRPGI